MWYYIPELVVREISNTTPQVVTTPESDSTTTSQQVADAEPVQSGLFAGYCKRKKIDHSASPSSQLMSYLSMCDDYESVGETPCLDFWSLNRKKLHLIFPVAMKIFSIPATSAPVERVFSHGGIIMRPHRACMSDTTLANLVFLKCNGLYKKNN
jgi:hypothetical protein